MTFTHISCKCEEELKELVIVNLGMSGNDVDETLQGLLTLLNELSVACTQSKQSGTN